MANQIREQIAKLTSLKLIETDFLGNGAFAEVYTYKINNTSIAVKCFREEKQALREKAIFEAIQQLVENCPGILDYYGMKKVNIEIQGALDFSYQGYALFSQQCALDFKKMTDRTQIPQKEIFNFLSQMSLTLLCLHFNGCCHGDLKPSNILVNKNLESQQYVYYLTDFGEGKIEQGIIRDTIDYKTLSLINQLLNLSKAIRGTPYYFSPELWQIFNSRATKGNYNPLAADIYSLGIICLELLLGRQQIFKLNEARLNLKFQINVVQMRKNMKYNQKRSNSFYFKLLSLKNIIMYDRQYWKCLILIQIRGHKQCKFAKLLLNAIYSL